MQFSQISQSERINFAIFFLFSIFSTTYYFFTGAFIYPNVETLLLFAVVSSFMLSIDFFLLTNSHDPGLIRGRHFPLYGYFLSFEYWSSVEKVEFYLILPFTLLLCIVQLGFAISAQGYKTSSYYSNDFIFLGCLFASLLLHLLFSISSRKRV